MIQDEQASAGPRLRSGSRPSVSTSRPRCREICRPCPRTDVPKTCLDRAGRSMAQYTVAAAICCVGSSYLSCDISHLTHECGAAAAAQGPRSAISIRGSVATERWEFHPMRCLTNEQVRKNPRAVCWPGSDRDIVAAGFAKAKQESRCSRRLRADWLRGPIPPNGPGRPLGVGESPRPCATLAAVAASAKQEFARHRELFRRVASDPREG